MLASHRIGLRNAVDVGCGKGRNSLFLARKGMNVTAMDFAPNAVATLQKMASRLKLGEKVRAIVQDATDEWPVETHHTDLAIDTFCFRHLPTLEACQIYKKNLLRILGANGYYLFSFASIGDGYYGHYVREPSQAPMPVDKAVCIDPTYGVECPLYTREKIIRFFLPELEVLDELKSEKRPGPDSKKSETYALLFRRSPKWIYT
jgi:SAM-dependent methyltransferase